MRTEQSCCTYGRGTGPVSPNHSPSSTGAGGTNRIITLQRGTTPMAYNFFRWKLSRWLRRQHTPDGRRARKGKPTPPKVHLDIERLEQRWMMTTVQFSSMGMFSVNENACKATVQVNLDAASA